MLCFDQKSSSFLLCRDDYLRAKSIGFPTIIEQKLQKAQNYIKIIEKSRQKIVIKPTPAQETPFQPPNITQNILVIGLSQIRSKFNAVQYLLKMVKSSSKKEAKTPKSGQGCTICMSRTVNCKTVDCSHEFCYRCLSKWTRRKGTCPMCRQDVRKIVYKNRVIEPQFLKNFDEEKIVLSEQNRIAPTLTPRPPRITIRPYLYVIPAFQNLAYLSTLNYYHYSYDFALQ